MAEHTIQNKETVLWINNSSIFYRKNNLIYAVTHKCASSFYTSLVKYNRWEKIKFVDIDWVNDRVFSFIIDPYIRYAKGLAEDIQGMSLKSTNDLNLLLQDNTAFLSFHSIPISQIYKDYAYSIDWIPLDGDTPSESIILKLFEYHNIKIEWPEFKNYHKSTPKKIELFNKVKELIGNGNHIYYRLLSTDVDLYNTVLSRFNPNGETWNNISWLQNDSR